MGRILRLILGLTGWFPACVLAQPFPAGPPPVVITEIMYDLPGSGTDDLEFIELRNPSPEHERSIGDYYFGEGISFTFPANYLVQPHEFVVVAKDSVAFESAFGISAFQWDGGDLSDTGELLILFNPQQAAIDSVMYSPDPPWPMGADGGGRSIVLCNDTMPNLGPSHWAPANTSTGVTVGGMEIHANPGSDCSGTNAISENHKRTFNVWPNPIDGPFVMRPQSDLPPGSYEITLRDLTGRLIHVERRFLRSGSPVEFTVDLGAGTYLLTLSGNGMRFSERLVRQ